MDITQTLVLTLSGIILVPLLQVLKKYLRLQGAPLLWVTFFLSLFLSGLVCIMTGKETVAVFSDPLKLFGNGSIIFGISQVVYRSLKERLNLKQG